MDNISFQNVHVWLGTFRYDCTRGQLNNEGGGELHKIKQSRDKTEIGKEMIWWVNKYQMKSLTHEITIRHGK